ncbi:hypothetical protein B0T11DRAFT_344682 [Plectosphaerella cucumerina]|uniref:Uncharacterized protein n=1 Tax=Plectosphaerella cucumerina TaxID=40658 RepID=A0A8K0X8S0_9PEZI|nr:hypothetical protein B0T11DRAFT_344682 [Plectosphaerella cucumerina]
MDAAKMKLPCCALGYVAVDAPETASAGTSNSRNRRGAPGGGIPPRPGIESRDDAAGRRVQAKTPVGAGSNERHQVAVESRVGIKGTGRDKVVASSALFRREDAGEHTIKAFRRADPDQDFGDGEEQPESTQELFPDGAYCSLRLPGGYQRRCWKPGGDACASASGVDQRGEKGEDSQTARNTRAQAGQPKLSNPPLPVRDPWRRRRSTSRCAYGTSSRGACGVERPRSVTGAPRPRFLAALGDKRAKAPVPGDLESRRDQSVKRKQPRATKTGHELSTAT